ncbi:aspergillopepsin I [Capronia coronata CBS 617.96]|uniref:Aspergillopepsin I n=1 Tax=Capronia coronata CBS 617.96 TaxID=1182541 RepID=W9YT40_9EURO|nr:aspergillopepsin I [Capronia coronata CBS 617.96]EXJ96072.1 aspergillopepsin I [Capronia coronata CBS 617.96]
MPSFSVLLAISALASFTHAKPIPAPQVTTKKGFTIVQAVAKPFQAGPVVLQKAYNKFNKAIPADVKAAAADGSVTATPEEYDAEYLCPVTVGGQTLNLDFDTGSADLWVFSSELPASQRSGHSYYDASKSNTSRMLSGATWNISYGDGSGASGNVYTDTVNVGGTTVTGQAVELASQISAEFQQDEDNDGLLGLAFSSINTVQPTQQTTFFDTAINEGALDQNVFTADLKKGAPGTYNFGFIDGSKHTGAITYTPVNTANGFWEFTGTGYGVGDGSFQQISIDAIADTGTTLLLLDDSIVSDYYSQVSSARYDNTQGGYIFPCSASLPDFVVGIEDYHAVVPGSFINFAPATGSTCYGGIQSNQGLGFSIYGDVFLKAVFAVFDSDNTQVGFAPKAL